MKRAAKVGDTVISEFLTKIQASIATQEESIEALKICLNVLLKKHSIYPASSIKGESPDA